MGDTVFDGEADRPLPPPDQPGRAPALAAAE
jgi:hypothetical protein